MNYTMVGIIVAVVVLLVLGMRMGIPQLKRVLKGLKLLELAETTDAVITTLADFAKMIADDQGDDIIDKVESVLLDTLEYVTYEEDVDYDETLEYVLKMMDVAGLELTDMEIKLINEALEIIFAFIIDGEL